MSDFQETIIERPINEVRLDMYEHRCLMDVKLESGQDVTDDIFGYILMSQIATDVQIIVDEVTGDDTSHAL